MKTSPALVWICLVFALSARADVDVPLKRVVLFNSGVGYLNDPAP